MRYLLVVFMLLGGSVFANGFKVGLGGYCPVGFVMANKHVFGDPKFASDYKGVTYYNSSAKAKEMFDKEPNKYVEAIQYNGYCATGLSMGKQIESDPTLFSKLNEKVYFFSSAEAKGMFDKDPKKFIGAADKEWAKSQKK